MEHRVSALYPYFYVIYMINFIAFIRLEYFGIMEAGRRKCKEKKNRRKNPKSRELYITIKYSIKIRKFQQFTLKQQENLL